jgi:large subunit ribosomal protein L6
MVKFIKIEEELEVPKGIDLKLDGKIVSVKGKLGTVTKDFTHARLIDFTLNGKKLVIRSDFPRKKTIALVITIKNMINNMFLGVTEGYVYKMKIVYSHFPITVETKKGSNVILIKNFIGERSARTVKSTGKVEVTADKEEVIVKGSDKDDVGQTCANIQLRCKIRDKDHRVFQDGIFIYEKMCGNKVLWSIK